MATVSCFRSRVNDVVSLRESNRQLDRLGRRAARQRNSLRPLPVAPSRVESPAHGDDEPSREISSELWAALAVVAKKPAAAGRDNLSPGEYAIDEAVHVRGTLKVGHSSMTAATVTPSADVLLGLVLAKLNTATRERILRELPAEFVAAGQPEYPEVPEEIVLAAETLTQSLRRSVTQHRRGAVTGVLTAEFTPSLEDMGAVGRRPTQSRKVAR